MASRAARGAFKSTTLAPVRELEQAASVRMGGLSLLPIVGAPLGGAHVADPSRDEMWELVKAVPELGNAMTWLSKGAARANMYPAEVTPQGTAGDRTEDQAVIRATAGLLAPTRMPTFMEMATRLWFGAGELYLFGYEYPAAHRSYDRNRWVALDGGNIKDLSPGYQVTYEHDGRRDERTIRVNERGTLDLPLIRMWNPDAQHPWQASSPVISCLDLLRAIVKVTRLVPALADQRIAGPRMLAVSDRLEPPRASPNEARYSEDELVNRIAHTVETAMRDPGAIDNLVAIILRGDLSEKTFEKLEWDTEFPELTVEILNLLLRRLALGLPLPPEVTLGESTGGHWGQWFTEESAVKLSIEPFVAQIASALSEHWLPLVLPDGYNPDEWTIGYDVRSVMLRPDRSAIAVQLHDRGIISDNATRRETGFDPKDAPSPAERARREGGSDRPIGANTGDPTPGPDPTQGDRRPHQQSEPQDNADRSARPAPRSAPPGIEAAAAAGAVAMRAALCRVGTKLRSSNRTLRMELASVNSYAVHTLVGPEIRETLDLSGAWPEGVLDDFRFAAEQCGLDSDCAVRSLETHFYGLVLDGREHDREALAAIFTECSAQ